MTVPAAKPEKYPKASFFTFNPIMGTWFKIGPNLAQRPIDFFAKYLISKCIVGRRDCWLKGSNDLQNKMKRLLKPMIDFLQKEWFLLVVITAIALIIFVLEIL